MKGSPAVRDVLAPLHPRSVEVRLDLGVCPWASLRGGCLALGRCDKQSLLLEGSNPCPSYAETVDGSGSWRAHRGY